MIKIRLEKWEKAVVYQVLEQDEDLRSTGEHRRLFEGDMRIFTESKPDITPLSIGIRGSWKENDYDIGRMCFIDNDKRDEYYNKVKRTLKAWFDYLDKSVNGYDSNIIEY